MNKKRRKEEKCNLNVRYDRERFEHYSYAVQIFFDPIFFLKKEIMMKISLITNMVKAFDTCQSQNVTLHVNIMSNPLTQPQN